MNNPREATELAVLSQVAATQDGVRILKALIQLPEKNRRSVVELVESIAELLREKR